MSLWFFFWGHTNYMRCNREARQHPRERGVRKHRLQPSSDSCRHLPASAKHRGANPGSRVALCLGLSVVTNTCRALRAQAPKAGGCWRHTSSQPLQWNSLGAMSHMGWSGVKTFKVLCLNVLYICQVMERLLHWLTNSLPGRFPAVNLSFLRFSHLACWIAEKHSIKRESKRNEICRQTDPIKSHSQI